MIGNDLLVVPTAAENPRLAHEFINFMLDEKHGTSNFVNWNGYQPPFTSIEPETADRGRRRAGEPGRRGRHRGHVQEGPDPVRAARRRSTSCGWMPGPRSRLVPETRRQRPDGAPATPRRRRRWRRRDGVADRRAGVWYPTLVLAVVRRAPARIWLAIMFVLPFYVVVLGRVRHRRLRATSERPVPVLRAVVVVVRHVQRHPQQVLRGHGRSTRPPLIRTFEYVFAASGDLPRARVHRRVLHGAVRDEVQGTDPDPARSRRSGSAT